MLTAKEEDIILGYLVGLDDDELSISVAELHHETEVPVHNVRLTLQDLQNLDLINITGTKDCLFIDINPKAYRFYNHGGFQAQEMIFKSQVNKLGLEIDKLSKELSPDVLDKIKNISEIASSVASVISVLPTK